MTKNDVNFEDLLRNDYKIPISNFDGKYTKTSMFLLNSLDMNIYNKRMKMFFVNAFLDDCKFKHDFNKPIFCLFKVTDMKDKDWRVLYRLCLAKPEFITDYCCGINGKENLVMIVFQCPKDNEMDYLHFKRGRYSKFSESYKSKFPTTITSENGDEVKSLIYGVIYKEDYMREKLKIIFNIDNDTVSEMKEYWDIPRKEREYYRYTSSKENELKKQVSEEVVDNV